MTELHVYEPNADDLAYTFGGRPAVRTVRPGDALRVYTEDCFGGKVTGFGTLPTQVCQFPFLNPVTGPFHVEGAEPGDTLALHFARIEPARDWAVSSTFPHFGALTSTSHTATLQPPLEERVWVYELSRENGTVRYRARNSDFVVDLPMEPMHGTVGVAPGAFEARMTITPDAHGGNMDTPELRAGVTVYFGVNVAGALFALGDGHARQGHGEVSGVAVEAAMHTTLVVELLKGVPTPWPRLESDEFLMSTGSARPLEDAYRISQHDLVTWVAGLTGLDELDAYQLVSQAGEAPVGNVCDTNYTMVAKVAKRYLRGAEAYEGVHRRLREMAAAL
ncbi:acetamidase/formamidase family protein [Dactylosporangium darangshiense]|uniref:Acetamidase/formamidase family protein n=1 Tax=Dactylosporangium darangshiense TaxID=579108 RepID=A0ABP8DLL5_9ACTN